MDVRPSKVKGSFLLFDEGAVPKTDVFVYSAFVRKPAAYNSAEALGFPELTELPELPAQASDAVPTARDSK